MKNRIGKAVAPIFRLIFRINPLKYYFYGMHKRFFKPSGIFNGVSKKIVYRNSFKLHLDINDWISQNLYFLGSYEEKEIRFLHQTLKKGDVFIDGGANIGLFSLVASKLVGTNGKVYAFEPFEANFQKLTTHININHLTNITAEKLAISDNNGEIELFVNESDYNKAMATSYSDSFTYREICKSVLLDEYFKNNPPSSLKVIKLDIEGGEYNALIGMKRLIQKFRPIILVEINPEILKKTNISQDEIEIFFDNIKYKKMYLDQEGKIVTRILPEDNSCNFIYMPLSSVTSD